MIDGVSCPLGDQSFCLLDTAGLVCFSNKFIAHLVTTLQCKLDLLCRGVCLVILFATCTTFLLLAYSSFFLVLCWLFSLISRKLDGFLILLTIFMSFLWKSLSLFLSRICTYFPYRYENIRVNLEILYLCNGKFTDIEFPSV